jgi:hypothetical protein
MTISNKPHAIASTSTISDVLQTSPLPVTSDLPGAGPDVSAAPVAAPERPRDALEAPFVKAKFDGLVLVCDQCEKRSSGPSKLTAKDARKSLKRALGAQRTRMRIVASSCLGLCPKKSIAIAGAAQGAPSVLAEVRNERDLKAVAARLADPRPST